MRGPNGIRERVRLWRKRHVLKAAETVGGSAAPKDGRGNLRQGTLVPSMRACNVGAVYGAGSVPLRPLGEPSGSGDITQVPAREGVSHRGFEAQSASSASGAADDAPSSSLDTRTLFSTPGPWKVTCPTLRSRHITSRERVPARTPSCYTPSGYTLCAPMSKIFIGRLGCFLQ